MKNKVSIQKVVLYLLCLLLILLLLYKCPFKFFLGIPCFGCGMTRALLSCLKFDCVAAFSYHPLFGFIIIAAIIWSLNYFEIRLLSPKMTKILGYASCVLFVITYLIRLYLGSNIVYIDFKEGLVYKVIQHFIS